MDLIEAKILVLNPNARCQGNIVRRLHYIIQLLHDYEEAKKIIDSNWKAYKEKLIMDCKCRSCKYLRESFPLYNWNSQNEQDQLKFKEILMASLPANRRQDSNGIKYEYLVEHFRFNWKLLTLKDIYDAYYTIYDTTDSTWSHLVQMYIYANNLHNVSVNYYQKLKRDPIFNDEHQFLGSIIVSTARNYVLMKEPIKMTYNQFRKYFVRDF